MTEDEKVYVKVPVFDGKKSKWNIFKAKMRSYVAQKGMTTILTTILETSSGTPQCVNAREFSRSQREPLHGNKA